MKILINLNYYCYTNHIGIIIVIIIIIIIIIIISYKEKLSMESRAVAKKVLS